MKLLFQDATPFRFRPELDMHGSLEHALTVPVQCLDHLSRHSHRYAVRRNIVRDHGARTNHAVVSYLHAGHQNDIDADENVIAHGDGTEDVKIGEFIAK